MENSSSLPTAGPCPWPSMTPEEWEQLYRELAMPLEEALKMIANMGRQSNEGLLVENDRADLSISDEQIMVRAENSHDTAHSNDNNAGSKKFACDEPKCRYSADWMFNLNRHKRRHLPKEAKETFKVPCTWEGCELTFYQQSDMEGHIEKVHRKLEPEGPIRRQASTPNNARMANCPKTYQSHGHFLRHLREKHNITV
ncbi:uncharacterized protein PGTG_05964 [Puccinia graminis f. sp. tritici CRL 75-36-700-3]|uniref:C2H2-type domain-containing protein n=1 Tax=Puccinia graminis f. sp. tritici (strain CRL 75-36-700-3 / race SCCL) TaxID=418459 RepID=E3K672_PUCGT|nr:uncharacterized protein PGTG_05964 [Puccinia graminis f. sp. tritici CRL 75-36-700-3]EFP79643.2 hypothetical protein PGTG_05964 [Puccinia graminis f. sp. tritici CRL 75-36-700-3]